MSINNLILFVLENLGECLLATVITLELSRWWIYRTNHFD